MLLSNQKLGLYTLLLLFVTAITFFKKHSPKITISILPEMPKKRESLSETVFFKSLYERETTDQSNSESLSGTVSNEEKGQNIIYKLEGLTGQVEQMKNFLYLTQTESCLPRHFKRPDQLGPANGDSYDMLVLSYKHPCTDTLQQYTNVEYVYTGKNTTWSTGRNLLFEHIKKNSRKYLYYIFMDDDIELYFSEPYQFFHLENPHLQDKLQAKVVEKYLALREQRMKSGNNVFREFEKFLLEFEPAVGLINLCFRERQNCVSNFYADIWEYYCSRHGPAPVPILSYSTFDGAFNAFHRDAIGHILPYRLNFENISWHDSQKYAVLLSDIKFQGQVLYHLLITGWGLSHRPYPRGTRWITNWDTILAELRETEILPQYHRETEVLPFNTSKRRFDEIRNPLPRRTPIIPYQHYALNMTRDCNHDPFMYPSFNDDYQNTVKW